MEVVRHIVTILIYMGAGAWIGYLFGFARGMSEWRRRHAKSILDQAVFGMSITRVDPKRFWK